MSRLKINLLAALALLATVFVCQEVYAKPATFWVNNDATTYVPPGMSCEDAGYLTIQAAVNAANVGDTVNVCPGSYSENVAINTNSLKVVSVGGAAVTTVSAAITYQVFQITAKNVTINGFTIVPSGNADGDIGLNLAVEGNANATIANNIFLGGRIGINLGCASANSTVAYNIVDGQSEAAINIDTCEGSESGSDGNLVHHNIACGGTFSYSIAAGEKSDNNNIHHNATMWTTVVGNGNKVHHNVAEYFNVGPGNLDQKNTIDLDVCPLALCR